MKIIRAHTVWQRIVGLIGKAALSSHQAFFIPGCQRIHTIGMRFPIDVVWLDEKYCIVAIDKNFSPWQISQFYPKATGCLEMNTGEAARQGLDMGLSLEKILCG